MDIPVNTYELQLSVGELHWLAGAFGFTKLYIPNDPMHRLALAQRELHVQNGLKTLQERGLLVSGHGLTWKVERLPAVVVQWMGTAGSFLRATWCDRAGRQGEVGIFRSNGNSMLVEQKQGRFWFHLFENEALLLDALVERLGIRAGCRPGDETYVLPQPLEFIPAVWKDRALGDRILRNAGMDSHARRHTMGFVQELQSISAIGLVRQEVGNSEECNQLLLLATADSLWAGEGLAGLAKLTLFSPGRLADAIQSFIARPGGQ